MLVNLSFYTRNGRLYCILLNEQNTMYSVGWVDECIPNQELIKWSAPFPNYLHVRILNIMLSKDVFINQFLEITEEEAKTIIRLHKEIYEI